MQVDTDSKSEQFRLANVQRLVTKHGDAYERHTVVSSLLSTQQTSVGDEEPHVWVSWMNAESKFSIYYLI